MKTGKAYAFLNYEGGVEALRKELEAKIERAYMKGLIPGLPDHLVISEILLNTPEARDHLPKSILQIAETTQIYGTAPASRLSEIPKEPKPAIELDYMVISATPEVSDPESAEPLGQARANQTTAGRLQQILFPVSTRNVVFYHDSRRKAQRYPY